MSSIVSIGTALPEHRTTQSDVQEFARQHFDELWSDIDRLLRAFDNGEIESRHFAAPADWHRPGRSFGERNDRYIEEAKRLSCRALQSAVADAGIELDRVDYILFVSTTGIATPSIDARLIQELPFRRNVRRLPIWGLGCAGGAAGLSRAFDITRAHPEAVVLVVVVELCSLTFVPGDLSRESLIAMSIFGDGAAAVVVAGSESGLSAGAGLPEIIDSDTRTLPDSLDVMGWDVRDEGLKIVISQDIPAIVRTFLRESIGELLTRHELTTDDIDHYVAHPGGAKVLRAYRQSLGLSEDDLRHTCDTLRECGNMSATSVLFVLERTARELAAGDDRGEELGILCALGPGFSSEVVLLRWSGA